MARPSKITDVLIDRFCEIVKISESIETAIKETGVGRESYFRWKRRVSAGKGTELERRFMMAVDKALGESKLWHESKMNKHSEKHWRAIAWWLERKYPKEYGRRRPARPRGPKRS
jgi:hypothetical protein